MVKNDFLYMWFGSEKKMRKIQIFIKFGKETQIKGINECESTIKN